MSAEGMVHHPLHWAASEVTAGRHRTVLKDSPLPPVGGYYPGHRQNRPALRSWSTSFAMRTLEPLHENGASRLISALGNRPRLRRGGFIDDPQR